MLALIETQRMRSILLSIVAAIPFVVISQKISDDEAAQLYIEALSDFESSPFKLHEKDKKVLVTRSSLNDTKLPKKAGQSI